MTSPTPPEIARPQMARVEKPGTAGSVAGQAEQGQTEQGQTEQGQAEQGQTEQGQTEQGHAEVTHAESALPAEVVGGEPVSASPEPAEQAPAEQAPTEHALAEPVPTGDAESAPVSAGAPQPPSGSPGVHTTLSPRVRRNRIIAGGSLALVIVLVLGVVIANLSAAGHDAVAKPTVAAHPAGEFDRSAFSLDDPASPWVVVNKQRPIVPVDFTPPDLVEVKVAHTWRPLLRAEAAHAVETMFAAATSEAGLSLESNSAYRSYASQVEVYTEEVASNGAAAADLSTARPGTSEHQTGTTIDIGAESGACRLAVCFADTAEGQWLAANAWRFGFLLRYPADKVAVTGYEFEPWHFRYVGTDLAGELHSVGVSTLEEFFGLPAAPTY